MRSSAEFRRFEHADCEQSIVQRFAAIVARAPKRCAVRDTTQALSYAALDRRANAIAQALLARRGSTPEPVAILVDQGVALIAAILGVLKAGKFYVPLDPAQPRARLAAMLADSRAVVGVADAAHAQLAPDCAIIDVASPGAEGDDPHLEIAPSAYAYIYYTTGTTGEPKGVLDSQRNVLHNIMRYTNGLAIGADDRLTLLQGPAFSGAVSSMFAALLNGACCLPFDLRAAGVARLSSYLRSEEVTIYHSVPAIFRTLAGAGRFDCVRVIRLEGDAASDRDARIYREQFSDDCVLANGLGTTETGLVRRYLIDKRTQVAPGALPIGSAIEDMDVFVCDERGARVPVGMPGEIAVRSDFLACGYWHRPEQTARAFRPDESARVYRTGDLGRMRADGVLEHLGRVDARVKVRGETVELAAVEAALLALPEVREAVAIVRSDAHGRQRLVAYYVAGRELSVGAIHGRLARTLTAASIPSAFMRLERMPLNENLKVDRIALPPPQQQRPALDTPYVAPRDPTEVVLADVWERLLGLAPVGVRDDFLDLGGDSLAAAEMLAALEAFIGAALSPTLALECATIESLVRRLGRDNPVAPAIVPLAGAGSRVPFYFLHGDYSGGGLYARALAHECDPDLPFFAVTPCGLDGAPAPHSIAQMAERHLCALQAHRARGPYALGGNCNGGLVALEMAARLRRAGEKVSGVVLFRAMTRNGALSGARTALDRFGVARRVQWFYAEWRARALRGRVELIARKLIAPFAHASHARHARHAWHASHDRQPAAIDLATLYTNAAAEFIPPRYDGPVVVLWPEAEADRADAALAEWRPALSDVRLELVPGDHLSALTVHRAVLAERIDTHLRRFERELGA